MTLYVATVDILVEADNDTNAMDGVGEMLRPLLQDPAINLLDWQYAPDVESKRYSKPAEVSPDAAERLFDEFEAG